jgi:hypothetical protein
MGEKSEIIGRGDLPFEIEIDDAVFRREEHSGQHKIIYKGIGTDDIAFLPDPEMFSEEERELQVSVWRHNGQKYKEAGLQTADERYDEDGNLIRSGYETGEIWVEGEQHPYLKSYLNPHLSPIGEIITRNGLWDDMKEETYDTIITLDRLKREGEISSAEDIVRWEDILEGLEVVIPDPEGLDTDQAKIRYENTHPQRREYLLNEFIDGLYGNTEISGEEENLRFEEDIDPRQYVKEQGLPASAQGFFNALQYNEKTRSIVVADLGEIGDAIFNGEQNRYDTPLNSTDEFTSYHNITYTAN